MKNCWISISTFPVYVKSPTIIHQVRVEWIIIPLLCKSCRCFVISSCLVCSSYLVYSIWCITRRVHWRICPWSWFLLQRLFLRRVPFNIPNKGILWICPCGINTFIHLQRLLFLSHFFNFHIGHTYGDILLDHRHISWWIPCGSWVRIWRCDNIFPVVDRAQELDFFTLYHSVNFLDNIMVHVFWTLYLTCVALSFCAGINLFSK